MDDITLQIRKNSKYLELLAKQYPTIRSVCTEIINLRAILNLPKGTEHFLSDLHGEYEAFTHILNNCSGVIREKVDDLLNGILNEQEKSEFCALIYYPELKLQQLKRLGEIPDEWYETTLLRMISLCKGIAGKYTRSKVRKALPKDFSYIIDELLNADYGETNQSLYYEKIMESILAIHEADDFILSLANLIKRLAVDRLHIVGDIFDRGPRPDRIMDMLMEHHSVDIQWGNHDILWMGAAAGNMACCAAVLVNSAAYGNLKVLEQGYGISLRNLFLFADRIYAESPRFTPRIVEGQEEDEDPVLAGKVYKALTVMMFKLEGQLCRRRPEYGMEDRVLLDKLDLTAGTVRLGDAVHPLTDSHLPTVDPADPLALSPEEEALMAELRDCFLRSARLRRHVQFLYSHGSMYRIFNQNLMFHGCIPMNDDGSFSTVALCGKAVSGKALLDQADAVARAAYFGSGGPDRQVAQDAMWYLWCGRGSPLFGRSCMTTFERLFIADEATWEERKNPYYRHIRSEGPCLRILREFGLTSDISHIINGHVPVRAIDGENPVKGGGRLVVIDGGFCRAYHPRTGIAGYTLIYNSYGMRLSAHKPFESTRQAVENNADIHSVTDVFETMKQRMLVMDTDIGQGISEQIYDLSLLLSAYRAGTLSEQRT